MGGEAKAIILTDGKAGHENQSKAFARALGLDFVLVPVKFKSRFAKAMSYFLDRMGILTVRLLDGVCRLTTQPPNHLTTQPPNHLTIIGTGSGTFYAAKALAKKLGAKCGVVLYPRGYDLASFDCILAPTFDNPAKRANVVEIPANLVANDAAFYEKGVAAFRERYSGAADNLVGVIVGGSNKCSTMSVEWMKARLDEIFAAWAYKLIYSRDHFNPIPAFVQLAKRLYVTAESTGMLSEACTFGTAEVVALDNLKPGPHKFRRFVENLRRGGYVDGSRKVDLSAEFARARALMGL